MRYVVSVATKTSAPSDRRDAASRLIGKLMNIGALLERSTNRLLLPYGLNHQQFSILFEVFRAGRVQQKDMINRLLLERAHVSKVVKKLEAMGLLQVAPHPDDGRSSWLSVSTEGLALIRTCQKLFDAQKQDWFRHFATQDLLRAVETVAELQRVLSERDAALAKNGGSNQG
jgi:DNA-binding MarR family transcriptional regulator